ncbi:GAF domain-containing protein [Couchioplanes caeruleus]|uniref:GAF domain-containing protein n=1 Tax=Couchioplanes caeruleus TaxID=56438 RepID=UPI0020C09AE6|nr:GAF domain-containing protein [Couchioplanes caeruleus]UQU65712.1 GAF domain-containing protein [Couchioplanes caeruleus]
MADTYADLASPDRLASIATHDLFDPDLRRQLDAVAAATAQQVDWPVAAVTVVLDYAQLLAGEYGLSAQSPADLATPVEWSFCARVVLSRDTYAVADAAADPELAAHPAFRVLGIRSYVGVPLVTADGTVVGAHCVADTKARTLPAADLDVLHEGGRQAVRLLEEYRRIPRL